MSRGKWTAIAIAAIIVAILLWRMLHHAQPDDSDQSNAPVPVTVVPAAAENVPVYLSNQGTVTALNTVNVQPQVGGQLLKLDFVEGAPVKSGQVLAEIDPRSLQAQLDQAVAKRAQDVTQLATAQANLARSESPQYRQYVAQIDRITQKNTVAQWQAAVAADDASIKDTNVQLGYTRVLSPIDGIAGIRQVDPGNVVTTSSTIVTVTQVHPIYVIFTLAGKYLDQVRAAQAKAPLTVAILDASNNVVEGDGVLQVIDNQIDPDTGSFKLRAEFPNGGNRLTPGQYANARLQVSVDEKALVVPAAAVQRGPNGDYAWLITDKPPPGADKESSSETGTARQGWFGGKRGKSGEGASGKPAAPVRYVTMRTVTQGSESGDSGVIVLSGLKAGDLVVTAGQFRLKEGSKVTALKPGEIPAPPTTAQIQAAEQGGSGRRGRGH
ncbi:MAG: efflux RND transporter periplasmic adaptor subunit [Proteobacteria bacterium]|nr:efflux RND transporter periplasmic adaptor subunit [Pseudomonadota bacterium]